MISVKIASSHLTQDIWTFSFLLRLTSNGNGTISVKTRFLPPPLPRLPTTNSPLLSRPRLPQRPPAIEEKRRVILCSRKMSAAEVVEGLVDSPATRSSTKTTSPCCSGTTRRTTGKSKDFSKSLSILPVRNEFHSFHSFHSSYSLHSFHSFHSLHSFHLFHLSHSFH